MASVFDRNGNYTAGMDRPEPEPGQGEGATLGDIGRRGVSGLTELGGQGASLSQYLLEQAGMPNAATIAKSASQLFHIGSDIAEEGITPGGQRAAGIQGYKEAPFSTFAMQVAGVAPTVAVMALVPGGFIGEGLAGGTMLAGQVVDQAIAKTNNLTDAQKQDQIPYYKYLRQDKGLSEEDAVANYHRALVPYKDLATAALIGTATMGAGARLLKNGAIIGTGGRLKGAVEAGTEAGIGGGAAAATAEVERQRSESAGKSPTGEAGPVDWHQVMSSGLQGAFDNGTIGLVGGAAHGGKSKEPKVTVPRADEEAPPTAPAAPPAALTPAVPTESQNMQPPPGLQHQLDLKTPPVAPTAPSEGGQQDIFAPPPPTGHSGVIHDAEGNVVAQTPPPPAAPTVNPPVGETGAVPTGAQAELPLQPPVQGPPDPQGNLFPTGDEPKVTVPAIEPTPPAPNKSLAEIQAEIAARKKEIDDATAPQAPGAVDTGPEPPAPPPAAAPAAEAAAAPPPPPKPRRAPKAKPAVQTVEAGAPDADQSVALSDQLGKPPAAAPPPAGKPPEAAPPPAAEAVPTVPKPPAEEPAKAPTVDEPKGVPDAVVTASQPPKGQGTGVAPPPPDAREPVATTIYTKPGAKGAASKRGKVPPPPPEASAEVTPEVSAALQPEAAPPAPAPAQPAPAAAAPAQPAPAAAAPQPSLAELLQQQQNRPPAAAPVRTPEVAVPAQPAPAPGKSLDQLMREQQAGGAAAPPEAEAAPAPEAAAAPTPADDTQALATQEGVRSQLPTGERILEGGSAAPAFDAARQAERETVARAGEVGEARADKLTTPAEPPVGTAAIAAERKKAVREATAAVAKNPKGAHPIHKEIVAAAAGGERGASLRPDQVARTARLSAAIAKWRDARQPGGELGPRTKADVHVGGAPKAKLGETTRGGTAVTETVRKTMDKAAEGRATRKAKLKEAAQKAADEELARQRAVQDAVAKPFSENARRHVEIAAHDPNRSPAERAKAAFALEQDDIKLARQREAASYVRPEPVAHMREAAAADRQKVPEPPSTASPEEWRAWMKKTLDVETADIERGMYGSGRSGEGPYRELGEEESGVHEFDQGGEGFHEGDRPTHEQAAGNVSLVDDPKGFARIAMQMQMQDAREMTKQDRLEGLPIKISRRVKPARQLTVDQLEQVRDNKSLPRNLREYASNKVGELLDKKPKKITEARAKPEKVTSEVRPERAGAKKDAEGVWRPTVGNVMLEHGSPYRTYGDALKAAEREAQHRIKPTQAEAAKGVDTAKRVRGLESDRDDLTKLNVERAAEVAAKTKEANGKQSLLERKALAAEAKAAGLSVKDFRAKLSTEIKEARAEVEQTKADIATTKARIKDLDAYIEHPETQRRRAEEVEEARERGRKPTGAVERGGGARVSGKKSLADIHKEFTEGEQAGHGDKRRRMEMPASASLDKPGDGEGKSSVTIKVRGQDVPLQINHSGTVSAGLESARPYIHGLTRTGEVADSVLKRVQKLAGDVAVHYMDFAEFEKIARIDPSMYGSAGFYDYRTNKIFMLDGLDSIADPDTRSHILFHEAIHAATSKVLDANPGFRMQVRALMKEAEAIGIQYDKSSKYAFTDEHEFLAEAWANKAFRDKLASYDISPELKKALAIEGWRKKTGFKAQLKNLWDALKYAISDALGVPKATSFLEATLATTERVMKEHERTRVPVEDLSRPTAKALEDNADPEKVARHYMKMPDAVHDIGEKLSHLEPGSKGQKLGFGIRTSDQLRQAYEHRFGARTESNPLRNFTESIEKAGVKAHVYNREGQALARRVMELSKNDKTKEAAIEFAKLAEAATIHNVHLDRANDHIDPASLDHAQARGALPALKARFEAMVRSAPETRALWRDAVDYFQKTHDAMAKALIDNHLELIDDAHTAVGGVAGLKQRLFDGTATADDMKLFSRGQADSFAQMREIHKMEGAYFPLMRRGDFAVRATMKVNPGKGQLIGENTVQFTDEKQAHDYAAKSPLKVNRTSEVFVDKNNPEQRVSKNNPDAVKAYRIEVQHEHLSFHEKEHQARDMQAELRADPNTAKVSDVQLRQNNPGYDVEMSSPQVQAIIRSIRQNASMSDAKKEEMIRSWIDVSHRLVAGNRVESRRIPRRNVLGASQDLGRNLEEYSQSTSAYRAKLEFAHPIHDALARMQKEHDDNRYSGDNQATLDRGNIIREMTDRLYGGLAEMNTKTNGLVQAVTTTSYLKSMGSPAHMLLHSTHPWMISMPVLGARHGVFRTMGALTQAYKDIGGLGAVKEGMRSFARSVASGGTSEAKNWLDHFEAEFHGKDKADILKMWRALAETGHIHPEAGMEAHRMDPGQVNPVLAGLRRVDAMVRELSSTSEALNRFAESAAAYRLERLKGKTHEEAVRYAKDTLANTQGLYSRTNVPRVFRTNQLLRMTLQFKQFPQMIYNLLAKSAYQALKGETREAQWEGAKQFAGVVGTHALMAGALGLPTEPIRAVMMLANAMGVPGMDWKEHEDQMTKWLAAKYGPQAAEIIMHGLTRALGSASFDAHHRLGLGTVAMGMDPRSTSESDMKTWAFDTFLGAPFGNAYDMAIKGPSELMSGNTAKGLEDMSPLKGITDPIKAVSGYLWGKQTARGNQMSPRLNGVQTFVQSIGLVPSAVSQANAATASVKETQFREGRERQSIINQSLGKPDGAAIARWNNQHPDRKISYSTLTTARREAKLPQALGQKVNKGNQSLIDATSRAYNLGGAR